MLWLRENLSQKKTMCKYIGWNQYLSRSPPPVHTSAPTASWLSEINKLYIHIYTIQQYYRALPKHRLSRIIGRIQNAVWYWMIWRIPPEYLTRLCCQWVYWGLDSGGDPEFLGGGSSVWGGGGGGGGTNITELCPNNLSYPCLLPPK